MIRGEKVILYPFSEGFSDEELQLQYKWSKDPEIVCWSNMAPTSLTFLEFVEQMQHNNRPDNPSRKLFAIYAADTGALIGRIGYFNVNQETQEAELGVIIGEKEYWNKGYGRDAVSTLLNYVFQQTTLRKIYLFTLKENTRARRAFAASGFREISVNKRFSFEAGEYVDVRMEITYDEWHKRHKVDRCNQSANHTNSVRGGSIRE